MQVSVEKLSKIERRLTIIVPTTRVDEAYARQINELVKKANIKGFRPGKAPTSYVEQRFGGEARQEAFSEVMQSAFYEALAEQKLVPVSKPHIEPKMMLPNQPFEFTASFQVLPEIDQVHFSLESLEKLVVDITPQDVEYVIEKLQKQYAKWNIVDRGAQWKDRVVIDYYAIFDGKSDIENKIQNSPLELGSKIMLPGFEEGLIGAKALEERTLNLQFPADFPDSEKAGKSVDFVVEIKQVYEAEVPAIDADFMQKLGVKNGNQAEFHEQIKQSLEQERDRLVQDKLKEEVFGQLLEQNPIDVPMSLIAREARNIHDEVYPQHQPHDHHQHSEAEMATFNQIAEKRVKLGLLIAEYAKQAHLEVDQERVNKRIKEIAAIYERPEEVFAWLSSDQQRKGIEARVIEDQVLDKLIESTSVKEKTITYAELKGIRI